MSGKGWEYWESLVCQWPSSQTGFRGNFTWGEGGQDKHPIKQIKNNSRNFWPQNDWSLSLDEKNRMIRTDSVLGGACFDEVINAERDHVTKTPLLLPVSCMSRNTKGATLSLFLLSQVNILV